MVLEKRLFPILVLLLALLPAFTAWLDEPFLLSMASRILIYALVAMSLDLILGYGGMVSFGHAAFFGLGAYTVGILADHGVGSAFIAWPLAIIVPALIALPIAAVSLRTSGIHFIMITLAFAQMIYFFFTSLEAYGGDDGLNIWSRSDVPLIDLSDNRVFYYVCLILLAGFYFFCFRLVNSRFGWVIRASKENDRRAQALGFSIFRYRLLCFVIAAGGAGLAGALIANQTEFVSPGLMHWTRSGEILVMVILGGMGSLVGALLGAAVLLLMQEVLSAYTEHWAVFLGPFLILVVLFARGGLFGGLKRIFRV